MKYYDRFLTRVWNITKEKMLYQGLDYKFLSDEILSIGQDKENREYVIVMQCTGLRDMYNELIYEGDVLIRDPFGTRDFIYDIWWDRYQFVARDHFDDHITFHPFDIIVACGKYHIQTNIYENPAYYNYVRYDPTLGVYIYDYNELANEKKEWQEWHDVSKFGD